MYVEAITIANKICLVTSQLTMKRANTISQLRVPPMYLIIFASWMVPRASETGRGRRIYARKTYRKENIAHVHQDHNEAPDPSEIPGVGEEHESNCDEVVRHHLQVIFPPRLCGQNEYSMDVERGLVEVVEFDGSR